MQQCIDLLFSNQVCKQDLLLKGRHRRAPQVNYFKTGKHDYLKCCFHKTDQTFYCYQIQLQVPKILSKLFFLISTHILDAHILRSHFRNHLSLFLMKSEVIQIVSILYTESTGVKADYLFTPRMKKEKVPLKRIHVNFQTN